MNRTPSLPTLPALPAERVDWRALAEYGLAAYFVALLFAPLLGPPALAATTGLGYLDALIASLQVSALGYVAGVVPILRPA